MERMIATRAFNYGGARLESGEQFFAKDGHVPFLTKTNRAAKYQTRDMAAEPSPEQVCEEAPRRGRTNPELPALRAEYERVFGEAPNPRLGANRLRAAINGRYQRRDMRAED